MTGSEILGESHWIEGKVCLITGASSGIGKFTAMGVAKMGARVVMASRDRARGEAARDQIIKSSGAKSENVDLIVADLSSLDSVRGLASDFLQMHSGLHVLVNNAGLILA